MGEIAGLALDGELRLQTNVYSFACKLPIDDSSHKGRGECNPAVTLSSWGI